MPMDLKRARHFLYSARITHALPEILRNHMMMYLVIVYLIIALFPGQAGSAVLLDRVVATVNDEVITWSELMSAINIEGKSFLEGVPDDVREKRVEELEKPFLNNLVEMKLQIQEARKMGLNVSVEELEGAIADIKAKYGMTDEIFMNSLSAEGLTLQDYHSRLSDQILLQKVVNFAVRSNIVVSDREIEEYYEANKDNFSGKEKLSIRQIFFVKPDGESGRAAIEEKARSISQRLAAGEDFAKLASEFSEGPSRQFGGDLGYISRGTVLGEVEDMAFALNVGEVSSPFWSPGGLHIIKVEDRIEAGTLDQVREKVKDIIYQQAFKAKYNEWRTGLRESAHVDKKL
jgi:peptidyl-prolyl cis-trans isomerase SurA